MSAREGRRAWKSGPNMQGGAWRREAVRAAGSFPQQTSFFRDQSREAGLQAALTRHGEPSARTVDPVRGGGDGARRPKAPEVGLRLEHGDKELLIVEK